MGPGFAQKTSATANPHQEAILEGQILTPTRQKRIVRCMPSQVSPLIWVSQDNDRPLLERWGGGRERLSLSLGL